MVNTPEQLLSSGKVERTVSKVDLLEAVDCKQRYYNGCLRHMDTCADLGRCLSLGKNVKNAGAEGGLR